MDIVSKINNNREFSLSKKYDYYGLCIITFNITSWTSLARPIVFLKNRLGLSMKVVSKVYPTTEREDFTYYVSIDRIEDPFFILRVQTIEEYSCLIDEMKLFTFKEREIYDTFNRIINNEDIMKYIVSIKVVLDIENKIYLNVQ